MLVLTRKGGERVQIGDEIVLEILEVRQGQVRLGIQAPAHIRIYREEIARQIREENRRATQSDPAAMGSLAARLRIIRDEGVGQIEVSQEHDHGVAAGTPARARREGSLRSCGASCCARVSH
jgi:carbon storage regulator